MFSDTWDTGLSTGTDKILRVGDTATYDLTLNLQEYTTRNVVVEDVLPPGMAYDSIVSITPTSGSGTFTYFVSSQPAPGATGTLRWVLGDIYNAPSNDNTPIDTLVIRYVAKVVTDAPAVGVGYTPTSILLDNQAKLFYTGGDPTVSPARLTSTATIDAHQPVMSTIAKTGAVVGRTAIGDGSNANP